MRKRVGVGLVAAVVAIGLVAAWRHELVRLAIETGGGLLSGYTVKIGDQRIGPALCSLYDVHVTRAGERFLDAERIDVRYSLRDLLPGSTHRFGLVAIDVAAARVTIVKFRDGSYNFIIPTLAPAGLPLPAHVDRVPIRFTLRMDDAALELREPNAYDSSAKDIGVRDFTVHASVDSGAVTHYDARGVFPGMRDAPFTIVGTIDAVRGYAMHRARAARFPLRSLANYFADTPVVRILRGGARNFDGRLYSLDVRPNEASTYHVNLQLDIAGGRIALAALDAPVDALAGHLQLVDNAVFLRDMRAKLAGVPLKITGGIFDLTGGLTGAAQLRLGIHGSGDLRDLRRAFSFTRREPVAGRIDLGVLVEGPVDDPLIVAQGRAPHALYRQLPFDSLQVGVVYHDNLVALEPLQADYGGVAVGIRGTLSIGKKLHSLLAVHLAGTTDRLPYLDDLLANEPMLIDVAVTGDDLLFHAEGSAGSARDYRRVGTLFELNPDGRARVAPFWLHTERGDFDGGYVLDRPHSESGFWAVTSGLRMRAPAFHAFPGLSLPAIPKIDAKVIDAAVAGGGSGRNVVLAGRVGSGATEIAGVSFDRIDAEFAGTLTGAAINRLHARGPWGRFDGAGAFSSQAFVARGQYRGTFEGLQPFLGSAIAGHGGIAGTTSIAVEPKRILVQGDNLEMRGATLRGVPIARASLTLAVEGDRLRVYSARARAAGGDVVAAGTFSLARTPPAGGGTLSLVADRLDAAQLRGIGLPLDAGRLSASGDLAAGAPVPRFDGGVTVAAGRLQRYAIAGGGDVRLQGNAAYLTRMLGSLGQTYAHVNGSIGELTTGSPAYALDIVVPAGSVAGALGALHFPAYMTQGSFNAALRLAGRGAVPSISGRVNVPAGNVNGLPFLDAGGELRADARGVSVERGSVLVGSTRAAFGAAIYPGARDLRIAAPHADLSDFNNFFDTGDTLAGRGSATLEAVARGDRLWTSGNIRVAGLRYRNLPLGDTLAVWSSVRNTIDGSLAIGGSQGMLHARGSVAIVPRADLSSTILDSRYDLAATLRDVDLSLWVPAAGFTGVPISGRVSGEGTVKGRYPLVALRGSAQIEDGTLGPLALEKATIAAHSAGTRVAIDSAEIVTPGLHATARGSFGLRPAQALDLQVHATSDDLPRLAHDVARVNLPVTGTFESTLLVGGTYRAPTFEAGVDASGVTAYGVAIASMFGEVKLHGRQLEISNAGATFAHGEVSLAGSLPLELAPFGVGPSREPVSFDVNVAGLDPAFLDDVLGYHTKLGGSIEGHVGVSGTVERPILLGHASLTGGTYVSDLERTPISQATAQLGFNRTSATISRLSAKLGAGTVAGSGAIEFPAGFAVASGYSFAGKLVANGAQFDLPAYGTGTLDAKLALTKTPASHGLLSGNVTLSNATLPFLAFINAAQQASKASGAPLPPLGFDLAATAGKNVRVRGSGYGAGLDIGAAGKVHLGGTLAAPTLAGAFTASSGGTLTYFDRAFKVQEGVVNFDPSAGLVPTIHAVAMSSVVNPDPDRSRNPFGSAQITIAVDGSIADPKIDFTSNPPGYTRDQIIAMIAPFGGFIGGIGFTEQVQSPGGFTPLGALAPVPNFRNQTRYGTITVGQEAFNILNAQFAAGLLAPVENAIGQGLGLSSVNLTLGYYGNVGVTATRLLGKTVSAVYATTFGIPQIQSFGIKVQPSAYTSASLSFFYQTGPTRIYQAPGSAVGYGAQEFLGQPLLGESGFSFTLKRYLGSAGVP